MLHKWNLPLFLLAQWLCEIIPETLRALWTEKVWELLWKLIAEFQRPELRTVMQSGCQWLHLNTLIESAHISGDQPEGCTARLQHGLGQSQTSGTGRAPAGWACLNQRQEESFYKSKEDWESIWPVLETVRTVVWRGQEGAGEAAEEFGALIRGRCLVTAVISNNQCLRKINPSGVVDGGWEGRKWYHLK